MAQLTGVQVAQLAEQVGVPSGQLVTCVAIAWAESGLRTDATGINPGPRPGTIASKDRGLWQINDYWHPDVSDTCAYDATCNAQAMYRISNHGTNWNPWSTFTNGAYQRYIAAATLAVHLLQQGPQPAPVPTAAPGQANTDNLHTNQIIAFLRAGGNPTEAVVRLVQDLIDETADIKFGPGNRPGPILGGIIK